jgi:hypothetical protein
MSDRAQSTPTAAPSHPPGRTRRVDRAAAAGAVATLVVAWLVGAALSREDITPFLGEALPDADRFERLAGDTFAASRGEERLGYVAAGHGAGYGGPITVAVAVDDEGVVRGTTIVAHRETPSFFGRVARSGLRERLAGKVYVEPFELDVDVDGVTGATATSRALAEAVRSGSRRVATERLGRTLPEPVPPPVRFGAPEIAVLALYAVGFVGQRRRLRFRTALRWVTLLTGLFVLGFWLNVPLTISKVSSFLLGFWPQWQTNLYWYLLMGGILFIATVDNKNGYCAWFCPFGAAQECMAVIGGARLSVPRKHRRRLVWIHRGLAWLALMLAFLLRNPGVSSYEVFGALFAFTGSTVLFALLGIVLVVSLFVKRPWCRFLCPLDPVYDVVRLGRTWALEQWSRTRRSLGASSS